MRTSRVVGEGVASRVSTVLFVTFALLLGAPAAAAVAAATAITLPPSHVRATSATLRGSVEAHGETGTCRFEYGTTVLLGSSAPCPEGVSGTRNYTAKVALEAGATYYYRIVAETPAGTAEGALEEFQTRFLESPPNFGRCVYEPGEGTEYGNSTCIKKARQLYEWFGAFNRPKPLAHVGFTFDKNGTTTEVKLETVAKRKLACKGATGSGEYTGSKTIGALSIQLHECKLGTASTCTSAGAGEGEIDLAALAGELGVITTGLNGPPSNKIGLRLAPESGETWGEFSCAGTAVALRGAVIVPVKSDAMLTEQILVFAQTAGVQKPLRFEGGAASELELSAGGGAYEQTGLAQSIAWKSEEAVEVNAVA